MGKMSQVTDSLSLSQYRITENFKDGKIIEGFIADKCYHFLVQKLSPRGSGKATECKQIHKYLNGFELS
jgi:hypothetical protein